MKPPGEPLDSGFRFRPASEAPEAQLSTEALARVHQMIDSVARARARAAASARTAWVG